MRLSGSYLFILAALLLLSGLVPLASAAQQDSIPDSLARDIRPPELGPYDTVTVAAKISDGTLVPAQTLGNFYVSKPAPPGMKERIEAWTRLRNAVYVTYPYARRAGDIMNDINKRIAQMPGEGDRKAYIRSREKDLRREFTAPLTNLSIYQGKVLMKLINRQTGNNCYDIIKEYKGGLKARLYQTVAFFFSTSLKQPYDAGGEDKDIEFFAKEVERMYH
jgi:hypothetical protein